MPDPRVTFLLDAKNLASREFAQVRGDIRGLERDAQKAGGGLSGFARSAGPAKLALLGLGVAGAGLAFVAPMLGDMTTAASNLNEQVNKSNVVFGSAAAGVQRFGDRAALALGLSKRAALEAAGAFGQFFTGAGQSDAAAAAMSKRMVTLAADLASFNNLDPTETLDKLRAGLSGESEPLRRVGVFLTEAKVKAKAMQLGLADAHGELSEGAKVLARYQLILEETQDAQGDFARTSTSLANQQRRNNAIIENAQARLGQHLIGYAETAATGFAFVLDEQFRNEVAFAEARVRLAQRTTADLRLIAEAHTRSQAGAADVQAATLLLFERQSGRTIESWKHQAELVKDDVIPAMEDLAKVAEDDVVRTMDMVRAATEKLDTALGGLSAEIYGTEILAGDLARAQKDLAETLKAGPETRKAQDVAIWRGEVAQARARVLELQAQLAREEGPKAFYTWITKQQTALENADPKLVAYLNHLKAAALIAATVAPVTFIKDYIDRIDQALVSISGPPVARQHGGPATADRPYIVGERGPELFVPEVTGRIVPQVTAGTAANVGWAAQPGQPVEIALILDGREIARVVDEHLYYSRRAAPS